MNFDPDLLRPMRPDTFIRDATTADVEAAARLIEVAEPVGVGIWVERLDEAVVDPSRHFLVALIGDEVVGVGQSRFVTREPTQRDESRPEGWFLSGLVVGEKFRQRGVGSRLIHDRVERLRPLTNSIYCAIEADNLPALAMHRKLGFEPSGTIELVGHLKPLLLECLRLDEIR